MNWTLRRTEQEKQLKSKTSLTVKKKNELRKDLYTKDLNSKRNGRMNSKKTLIVIVLSYLNFEMNYIHYQFLTSYYYFLS